MGEFILDVKNVSKIFPAVKALDNVSLRVRKGEIHAFVGENGAGKSTLMKILNGNYKKDEGSIYFDGKEADIKNPEDARNLGISIIFQELNLVPHLSIAENIYMGRLFRGKFSLIDWEKVYKRADELMEQIGYRMDSRTKVESLSVAQKQMVEIAKALSYPNTKLILMDEPSATLTTKECKKLFDVIRSLKERGVSVIYISHKLEEIDELCEWVTILRDGKIIDSGPISSFTRDQMIAKMIGREITNKFPKRNSTVREKEVLSVKGLNRAGVISDVSFSLREGEVLGFAGLVGAGRTEIARAICGVDYTDSGEIFVGGERVKINNPKDALKVGIAYLSEDRKQEGLVLKAPIKWNISMANMENALSMGMINEKKDRQISDKMIQAMLIKTASMEEYAGNLSGGNQQKIVIGKWLNTNAKIFIFDEPTRGIDVGAKYEIYLLINRLVEEGRSVILISSEMPEVLEMSDRVLVINKGTIVADLSGEKKNAQTVMEYAI
ncbi:MAG: sugar ABC transporter ATP-binding protein [Lachnospiraceae bacterium]|nr:sugar ABC transporter ATP-binding protein [Lachnospiraceae bacterium]